MPVRDEPERGEIQNGVGVGAFCSPLSSLPHPNANWASAWCSASLPLAWLAGKTGLTAMPAGSPAAAVRGHDRWTVGGPWED